ncbi:Membrane protein containing HD superfamily hydrolase domain, YQFF ortholog [Thermobrachium celere DSM 8682]|uniref:Membrane protein containing HD superfamily hydrolase domain, YQFF ortholog n=2 Tax=Thermobrachium TaxID=150333 RepID=R7RS50_9CLOT|nr:Membrane protein containing HD superfamily hydrolase domain, YQFF ortholog [Thermobrachium celere DSM 8682]
MKNKRYMFKDIFNEKIIKLIIFVITFIILFLISSFSVVPKKYSLKVGDIAPIDIKAPRDFEDEVATQEKINKALEGLSPKYNKDLNIAKQSIEDIESLINDIKTEKKQNIDDTLKIERLKSKTTLNITDEDIKYLLKLKEEELDILNEFFKNNLIKVLSQDIRENNLDDIKKAQQDLDFYIKSSNLPKNLRDIANTIGIISIKPNMFFDYQQTEDLKQQIKKQIDPVIIKKNQNIILKGEVVNEHHIYLLSKAGILSQNKKHDLILYTGIAILVLLELFLLNLIVKNNTMYDNFTFFFISNILIVLTAILSFAFKIISVYLIPISFLPILSTLIFGHKISFILSLINLLVITIVSGFNLDVCVMYVFGSILGTYFTSKVHERNNILLTGFYVGAINFIIISSINILNNSVFSQTFYSSIFVFINSIVSSIFSIGILPVFEQFFDILTPIKLLELSNPNQVLLKKLLFEAPGTYHHSILVGNLAEAAADEIGANALLARVGSYYHDIGKIKRPYFFKENQITNDNPHDKVTPRLSVSIITSHVRDGIELAQKYKLPKILQEIIMQHHGTTLVKYFYVQALNDGEIIKEENFRYEGPKPNTKESAIIMLADSVEAAVRSISNPTVDEIKSMVEKVVNEKLYDNQLNDSPLTLKDIEKIKEVFVKVLIGIFHNRIEYPDITKEE